MTIQDVWKQLEQIDRATVSLFRETGFSAADGLGSQVCHLADTYEDSFVRSSIERILDALTQIHEELCYLGKPSHGEHTLKKFPNGRYGYSGGDGAPHTFTCGECLEAKISDPYDGQKRWVPSRIEHDGQDYYLAGFRDMPLNGLTIRERW